MTLSAPRYGRFDQFHGSASTDATQLRDLATRLELRGRAPDEVAARAAYLDLLGIQPGEQVLLSDTSAWDSVDRVRLR